MGLFDEQIKKQTRLESESFSDALQALSSAVLGRRGAAGSGRMQVADAMEEILEYYGAKPVEIPAEIASFNEALDYMLGATGIMRRKVRLKGRWYKDCVGAMLAKTPDGYHVALIPGVFGGYSYFSVRLGKRMKINRKNVRDISPEAICFYKPLALKALGIRDLIGFIASSLSYADYFMVALATLAVSVLGMVAPYVNALMFGKIVPEGEFNLLFPVSVLLAGVAVSSTLIRVTKSIVMARVNSKTNNAVQSASMMRLLSLPAGFFRNYSVGELSNRVGSVNGLCEMLSDAVFSVALTGIFSVLYIFQIFDLAPELAMPAILITLVNIAFSLTVTIKQLRLSRMAMDQDSKNEGLIYMLIAGLSKIKVAGAEKLAFSKWANQYVKSVSLKYNPPTLIKFSAAISTGISLMGSIVLYYCAVQSKIGVAGYMAFNTSYAMVSGAFASLSGMAITAAQIKTVMGVVDPLLKTVPENAQHKRMVTGISGKIEISNVTFRYVPDMPPVLENFSLSIKQGQYLAIVGRSGCGKSTLLRLLLGLETPQKGAIYYGTDNMQTLNLGSLRRHIGVVMQDGQLLQGDIFSNIVLGSPWLTMDDAWEAAEAAGIAEDIRRMPMGMGTLISEGSGGVSGGQKQRIIIARAIAAKPQILMFDEATSALDNLTQKIVSDSLLNMKRTRIVVAHRLSTIRCCERIVVLDDGKIAEDGTYEELIAQNGVFSEMVKRQQLGNGD